MNSKTNMPVSGSDSDTPGSVANKLVRQALKASLATLDRTSGHPYVSLVTLATGPEGMPVMLISRLALHTQNLLGDTRASLLCDGTGSDGDPLAGGRVTLIGHVERTDDSYLRARFLARHPSAAMYANFADFSFMRLHVERAHYVGGFGRIVDLSPEDMGFMEQGQDLLAPFEADIIEHMNADHREAVSLYATRLASKSGSGWRMTGIDPSGLDIVGAGQGIRLSFAERVTGPGAARQQLVRMAEEARKMQ
jgi:hypothetical protein